MTATSIAYDAPVPYLPPAKLADLAPHTDADLAVATRTRAEELDELTRRRADAYLALVNWLDRL
ncbi:MAG: hypothetical protein ACJ8AO_16885 [Gemmatimonadaceae bacterium]